NAVVRHIHIEQNNVGALITCDAHRITSTLSLCDHLEFRRAVHGRHHAIPKQRMVVDDGHADNHFQNLSALFSPAIAATRFPITWRMPNVGKPTLPTVNPVCCHHNWIRHSGFPSAARLPRIQCPRQWLWIPGSPPRGAPELRRWVRSAESASYNNRCA